MADTSIDVVARLEEATSFSSIRALCACAVRGHVRKENKYAAFLTFLVLSGSQALAAPSAASSAPSLVVPPTAYDTGYEIIPPIISRAIHWLDNERVLFAGMKAGRGPRPDLTKLYIWNISTASVRFYAEAKRVCVADGFVRYVVSVDKAAKTQIVKEGPFGSEKEYVRPLPSSYGKRPPEAPLENNLTCKTYSLSEMSPPPPAGHRIVVLRDGDGYLDMGREMSFEPTPPSEAILLYGPRDKDPAILPILLREYVSPPVFSKYIEAYVMYPSKDKRRPYTSEWAWPTSEAQPIYILSGDGAIRIRLVPPGKWQNIHWPSPVRAGVLFGGGNFYKTLGLYLLRGDVVLKVDTGAVREIAVSPDGCKAAVGIQNEHLEMGTPTNLRVFNFCR